MQIARAIVVSLLLPAIACAQEAADLRGEVPGTRKKLVEAEQAIAAGKGADARRMIEVILDDAGDDLILISDGRFVTARWFGQRLLQKLPEEEWRRACDKHDAAAKQLLAEGQHRRRAGPLLEILDRHWASSSTAQALKLLGDLAFERGDFATAERYWLSLTTAGDDFERCRGADVNTAEIEAMIVLAARRQNEARAMQKLAALAGQHAESRGRVAGQNGKLIDILKEQFEQPIPIVRPLSGSWPMLGGDPARSGAAPGDLMLLRPKPTLEQSLPLRTLPGSPYPAARLVAFHPVFWQGKVLFATENGIQVCDGEQNQPLNQTASTAWRDADFSLAIHDAVAFARLGIPAVLPKSDQPPSTIAAYSLETGKVLWSKPPPGTAGLRAGWEGAPVVVGNRCYAAWVRIEGGRLVSAIAALDRETGDLLFSTDLCESAPGLVEGRERHELLALAGRNLVFVSQTGIVAAVDAATGKRAWAYRYPRIKRVPFDGRYRDLSPAVASDGHIFIAPNDSDRLFALDSDTGKLLWQSPPLVVDHILGVSQGKVIASIAGPQRGLRAFHVEDGRTEFPYGWQQHDDPYLSTLGRGLIAGDHIAWPTQAGLYLINLQTGLPARPMFKGVHGNLAYANGTLAVLSAKSLMLFESEAPPR